ncbi:hypothetical protein ACN42_g10588 [Penicillium freii]|uniref:Uncharacterized protein n=1 Tax=Penicillium freii TaxID=48697 RepID=A0A117NKT5_PENFR|nr:hypothetical protein ACN42_g10588 [Penicillium freii]
MAKSLKLAVFRSAQNQVAVLCLESLVRDNPWTVYTPALHKFASIQPEHCHIRKQRYLPLKQGCIDFLAPTCIPASIKRGNNCPVQVQTGAHIGETETRGRPLHSTNRPRPRPKAQPNPQPINGGPSKPIKSPSKAHQKPIKSPFRCTDTVLAYIK